MSSEIQEKALVAAKGQFILGRWFLTLAADVHPPAPADCEPERGLIWHQAFRRSCLWVTRSLGHSLLPAGEYGLGIRYASLAFHGA